LLKPAAPGAFAHSSTDANPEPAPGSLAVYETVIEVEPL
jgi:hypothetical protein